MKVKEFFTAKRLFFIALFAVFAFITQRINFSGLVGAENQFFTVFQFVGPIAGAFLGPFVGIFAVGIAELVDMFVQGKAWTMLNILRLAPMLFATYYFASAKRNWNVIVPLVAIAVFIAHPVGRTVWFFALFWTIPILLRGIPEKYAQTIPARSLGATFTAHAIGGALWIWTVPMTAADWIGLIPIVAYERLLFATGIALSFIAMTYVLAFLIKVSKVKVPNAVLRLNRKYTFG